jgi:hypothetical protein
MIWRLNNPVLPKMLGAVHNQDEAKAATMLIPLNIVDAL